MSNRSCRKPYDVRLDVFAVHRYVITIIVRVWTGDMEGITIILALPSFIDKY